MDGLAFVDPSVDQTMSCEAKQGHIYSREFNGDINFSLDRSISSICEATVPMENSSPNQIHTELNGQTTPAVNGNVASEVAMETTAKNTNERNEQTCTQEVLPSDSPIDDKKSCICKECGKVFNSVWYLKQHAVKHSSERPFKCKYCHKTYRFRSNLYQHKCPLRDDASGVSVTSVGAGNETSAQRRMSSSTISNSSLPSSESSSSVEITPGVVRIRKRGAQPLGAVVSVANCTGENCKPMIRKGEPDATQCIRLSQEEIQKFLDRHKDKLYKCPRCKSLWPTREYLTRHMEWHNDDNNRFKCVQCSETFVDEHRYGMHKRNHSPCSLHVCGRCRGKFCTRVALKKHARRCCGASVGQNYQQSNGASGNGFRYALFMDQTPPPTPILIENGHAEENDKMEDDVSPEFSPIPNSMENDKQLDSVDREAEPSGGSSVIVGNGISTVEGSGGSIGMNTHSNGGLPLDGEKTSGEDSIALRSAGFLGKLEMSHSDGIPVTDTFGFQESLAGNQDYSNEWWDEMDSWMYPEDQGGAASPSVFYQRLQWRPVINPSAHLHNLKSSIHDSPAASSSALTAVAPSYKSVPINDTAFSETSLDLDTIDSSVLIALVKNTMLWLSEGQQDSQITEPVENCGEEAVLGEDMRKDTELKEAQVETETVVESCHGDGLIDGDQDQQHSCDEKNHEIKWNEEERDPTEDGQLEMEEDEQGEHG